MRSRSIADAKAVLARTFRCAEFDMPNTHRNTKPYPSTQEQVARVTPYLKAARLCADGGGNESALSRGGQSPCEELR